MLTTIDAAAARSWAIVTRAAFAARRAEIDALNVFPVADGDTGSGPLLTLLVGREGAWRLSSPRLQLDVAGTGDVLTALMATFLLRGEAPHRAAERALAGVHATLESTLAHGWEELDVLAAAAAALAPGAPRFPAVPL